MPPADDALLLLIWNAVSGDDAMATLLEGLAAAFACPSSALVYKDAATPAAEITMAYGPCADLAVQRRYALEFAAIDPAPEAFARLAVGEVGDTDSLFPAEEHQRYRAFLGGFYHPLGLAGALGAPLCKGGERIGMIAVHRDAARPSFNAADVERMRRLVPHLARMIEARQAFATLGRRAVRLGEALDAMSAPVVVLDGRGIIADANQAARALLAREDGLSLRRSGQFRLHDAAAMRAFRDACAAAIGDSLVRAPRCSAGDHYVLRVRRTEDGGNVVVISDPGNGAHRAPELLAAALGLPGTAAELVAALMRGETMNGFCARRRMSRNTAKYHLRAAFVATGTRRQADLVRHAATVVRDLLL